MIRVKSESLLDKHYQEVRERIRSINTDYPNYVSPEQQSYLDGIEDGWNECLKQVILQCKTIQ